MITELKKFIEEVKSKFWGFFGKAVDSTPLILVFSLFISVYVLLSYRLSKELGIALLAFTITGSLSYFPSKKLVEWLHNKRYFYLLELRAVEEGIGLYKYPMSAWKDIEVEEGDLFEPKARENVKVCQYFDKENKVAFGTWRGSCSDLELLRNIEKIKEMRDSLEEMAQKGLVTRTRLKSIVRGSINRVVREMVKETEEELLFSGEEIKEVVKEEMEKSGIYD